MVSFSQARDMFRLQREAKRAKKELQKIQVEAEAEGVVVVVSGEQEILSISIAETVDRERIPTLLKDALNRAMKKAQVVSAERMQGVYKEMGLPTEQGMRGMSGGS
jgi:DNA-binding protein YbaB